MNARVKWTCQSQPGHSDAASNARVKSTRRPSNSQFEATGTLAPEDTGLPLSAARDPQNRGGGAGQRGGRSSVSAVAAALVWSLWLWRW